MQKYYLSYADAGMPMKGFTIVEADSIGEACHQFCNRYTKHCRREEVPWSGQDALLRIRRGISPINFCFLLPLKLQWIDVQSLRHMFYNMSSRTFTRYFKAAWEKIARTGISIEYPEPLRQAVLAAEKPLNPNDAFSRRFKRTFMVWNMLEKIF